MSIWFTSDQHFGHARIIEYSSRPFESVEEMDEAMVERFNRRVGVDDLTYHLGDFSLSEAKVKPFLSRLNGTNCLVAGNHDRCHPCHRSHVKYRAKYITYGFSDVCARVDLSGIFPGCGVVLATHMPVDSSGVDERYQEHRPLPGQFDWLLHGHVHERWKQRGRMINVGVDQWDFEPVPLEMLRAIMLGSR